MEKRNLYVVSRDDSSGSSSDNHHSAPRAEDNLALQSGSSESADEDELLAGLASHGMAHTWCTNNVDVIYMKRAI